MAIVDVSDVEVHVAATIAGPFARIEDVTSYEGTHGTEGETRRRVFGRADAYVRAGENTDEYAMDGLYNPDDTLGQNVLRASRDNRGTCVLAIVTDPTPGSEKGYTQEVRVTEYTDSGEADGEFVECSFSAIATGTRANIGVGGLP
jgi:hypothetical protein